MCKSSGQTGQLAKVIKMVFGTGGVNQENQPTPPDASDTALKNQTYEKNLDSTEFPTTTTCRFKCTLTGEECNGQEISEIALKDEEGDLVAIKTFGKKTKDAESTFVFEWDEEF
ncbi:phage tail protein [Pelosinus sp. Bkl1]|uniref:Phage tail protein n=2 Tax=Pelosinus baikalensis TaxID=2892015 RepID=A0ABS8HWT4_9FIRM|nr:phage tail protein [Pelosinus baikalensis]